MRLGAATAVLALVLAIALPIRASNTMTCGAFEEMVETAHNIAVEYQAVGLEIIRPLHGIYEPALSFLLGYEDLYVGIAQYCPTHSPVTLEQAAINVSSA